MEDDVLGSHSGKVGSTGADVSHVSSNPLMNFTNDGVVLDILVIISSYFTVIRYHSVVYLSVVLVFGRPDLHPPPARTYARLQATTHGARSSMHSSFTVTIFHCILRYDKEPYDT